MIHCTDLEELVTLSYCEVFWVPLCWLHLSSNLLTNHGFIHGRTDEKNNEPSFGEFLKPCHVQEAVSIWRSSMCSGDGDCREERK